MANLNTVSQREPNPFTRPTTGGFQQAQATGNWQDQVRYVLNGTVPKGNKTPDSPFRFETVT